MFILLFPMSSATELSTFMERLTVRDVEKENKVDPNESGSGVQREEPEAPMPATYVPHLAFLQQRFKQNEKPVTGEEEDEVLREWPDIKVFRFDASSIKERAETKADASVPTHNPPIACLCGTKDIYNSIWGFKPVGIPATQTATDTGHLGSQEQSKSSASATTSEEKRDVEPKDLDVESDPRWKERGTGLLKFLRHKTTLKTRLLLRQEKTLKCCINHGLKGIVFQRNSTNECVCTYRCMDYSNHVLEPQVFSLAFNKVEDLNAFLEVIQDLKPSC